VIAGGVAASATAGALVAMGRRLGSSALPFRVIAGVFGAAPADATLAGGSSAPIVAGVVAHVVVIMIWAVLFALLVERWRGGVVRAALAVSAIALAITWLLTRAIGRGLATTLPLGDLLVLALVLALALVVGMRLALPARDTL